MDLRRTPPTDDSGMTITEALVAMAILGMVMTMITGFLISGHQFVRDITNSADRENLVVRFSEDFTTAFANTLSIRSVWAAGTGNARESVRFDFVDREGNCATYEVVSKNGKPTTSFTSNVDYFEYRKGVPIDSAGAPTCVKSALASTTVRWAPPRWALGHAEFTYYRTTGAVVTGLPTTTQAADSAAYNNIARVEFTLKSVSPGESSFTTGVALPTAGLRPAYG